MQPNGKPVSIKTVAAHLGLSHATVSRALNDKSSISEGTKARVREAAEELGYIANSGGRMLRGMPGRLVGLIIPDVQNDFYSTVAKVLAESCAAENLQLILAISEDDSNLEYQHIRSMLEARVIGILITPTSNLADQSANLLATVPYIQIIRKHRALNSHRVGIADSHGTYLATKHLLDLGHKQIGFIGGSKKLNTTVERLDGYRRALKEAGIRPSDDFVRLGLPRPEFGNTAATELCQLKKRPTALVVSSSELTLGALNAFKDLGLSVPKDISIVGYGSPPWFELTASPITTIDLPVREISCSAASLLFNQIREPGEGKRQRFVDAPFSPTLRIRSSTAPFKR